MSKNFIGSCLCGVVEFQISGKFESFFLCHCNRCQKDTGSAHAANLFSSVAVIDWAQGEDKVKTFVLPNTRHGRSFCIECGGSLPRTRDGMVVVPAGSLDSEVDIRPETHIFLEFKADWDDHLEDVEKLQGPPKMG